MKIIIIGNNSILGKELFKNLNKEHIVLLAGRNGNYDIYFDLAKENDFTCVPKADIIINCAAVFPNNLLEGFRYGILANTLGIIETIKLAKMTGSSKYINISSISVYNKVENEYRFTSYSASKRFGEDLVSILCNQINLKYLNLRFTQLYDYKLEEKRHQSFLYTMIDKVSLGQDITIYGNLDCYRNYLSIEDSSEIIKSAINKDISGMYPVMSLENLKISEIINIICKVYNKKISVKFDSTQNNLSTIYIPKNIGEIYNLINYKPRISLEEGIKKIKKFKESLGVEENV